LDVPDGAAIVAAGVGAVAGEVADGAGVVSARSEERTTENKICSVTRILADAAIVVGAP